LEHQNGAKKTFTLVSNFKTNVTFPDCYVRVTFVESTKESSKVTYGIFNASKEDLLSKREFISSHNLDSKNFIAQEYDHMKTMPEFAGAIDC
jgi:hypothetical protein